MAMLPSPIYKKMKEVFVEQYEMGELKNQKSRKRNLQKMLEGKFSPKLQHFKIFQGLTVQFRIIYSAYPA